MAETASIQPANNNLPDNQSRTQSLARRGLGDFNTRYSNWTLGRLEAEVKTRGVDYARGQLPSAANLGLAGSQDAVAAYEHLLDLDSHAYRTWEADKEPVFFLQQMRNRAWTLGLAEQVKEAEALLDGRHLPHLRLEGQSRLEDPSFIRSLEWAPVGTGCAISPDGQWVAGGLIGRSTESRLGNVVGIWNLRTGKLMQVLIGDMKGVYSLAFSVNGSTLFAGGVGEVLSWDISTGNQSRTFSGHHGTVINLVVSSDGLLLISGSAYGEIWIWDIYSGERKRVFNTLGRVNCLALSNDQGWFATPGSDHSVDVWDFASGQFKHKLVGHRGNVQCAAFNRNSTRIATLGDTFSDHTLRVWSLASGECEKIIGSTYEVASLAFSSDNQYVVGVSATNICIWDLVKGDMEWKYLFGNTDHLSKGGAAVTPDGQLAVNLCVNRSYDREGNDDNRNRSGGVWSLSAIAGTAGTNPDPLTFITDIAVSADGMFAASIANSGRIYLSEIGTNPHQEPYGLGQQLEIALPDDVSSQWDVNERLMAIAFSPQNDRLAVATGKAILIWDVHSRRLTDVLQTDNSIVPYASRIAFTSDGQMIVVGAWYAVSGEKWDADGGELQFWNIGQKRLVTQLEVDCPANFAMMPDGYRVCVESGGSLRICHSVTGLWERDIHLERGGLGRIVICPRGGFVAGTDETFNNYKIILLDLASGKKLGALERHTEKVSDIAISTDARWLASVSLDATLFVWDITTQSVAARLDLVRCPSSCSFTPDGKYLLIGGSGGISLMEWKAYA